MQRFMASVAGELKLRYQGLLGSCAAAVGAQRTSRLMQFTVKLRVGATREKSDSQMKSRHMGVSAHLCKNNRRTGEEETEDG